MRQEETEIEKEESVYSINKNVVKTFYCPVLVTRSLPPPLLYQWTLLSEHLSSKTDSDFTLLIPLPPNAHRHTHTHIYTLLGPLGDSAVAGTKLRAR